MRAAAGGRRRCGLMARCQTRCSALGIATETLCPLVALRRSTNVTTCSRRVPATISRTGMGSAIGPDGRVPARKAFGRMQQVSQQRAGWQRVVGWGGERGSGRGGGRCTARGRGRSAIARRAQRPDGWRASQNPEAHCEVASAAHRTARSECTSLPNVECSCTKPQRKLVPTYRAKYIGHGGWW